MRFKHRNKGWHMLSWSGQLDLGEAFWGAFKIAVVGAILIFTALFYANSELDKNPPRQISLYNED